MYTHSKKRILFIEGQAALIMVFFSLLISLALVTGFSAFAVAELQSASILERSKESYAFAEGALEDAMYRIISGKTMPASVSYQAGSLAATTTVSTTVDGVEITTQSVDIDTYRTVRSALRSGEGVVFNYGVQVGNGGFLAENSSSIQGSVYANGTAIATQNNIIGGALISAGLSGLIDGFHATGTAYAHTIQNAEIDGDAHYQTILNTVVLGAQFPGSNDLPPLDLPISDSMIDSWEDAASSTVISSPCPYIINNDIALGLVKIECSVIIKQNPTVTLTGPVWVQGNLTIENSPILRIDSAVGGKSVPIVVDDPSNRLSSSKVILKNSTVFQGSGSRGSYILIISQNTSSENGGSETAILIDNSASGELLVYAGHGEILLANNVSLREVTAYKVHTKNSAKLVYEQGLANLLFESGPSGGWTIDTWKEIE